MVQGTVPHLVAAVLHRGEEGIVDGGKDQDLFPLGDQRVQGEEDGGDHAVAKEHPVGLGLPAVAAVPPALDGLINRGQGIGITDDGVVAALLEGLLDLRHRREIGVRNPEGQQAGLLAKAVLEVPLDAGGAPAVYHFVEIIHPKQILSFLN